eukprot:3539249-Amphidinium_carterae.2
MGFCAKDKSSKGGKKADEVDILELLERAQEKAALGRYKTATLLYERALRTCESMSAIDMDLTGKIHVLYSLVVVGRVSAVHYIS